MALPKVGVEAVIEGMAKFEADSKKVNKSLDNMGTSTSKLGNIASGVTSKLTSLAGGLLKIGAVGAGAGILAIGAGLFKAGEAGLSMNNAMEQASAKINAFTKDAGATADILEMIRVRASKTPFEFQEMANAAAGLLPAARQAGIGLEEIIEQAEILAASNPAEGLEGAAFALREAVSGDFTSVIERFNLPRTMINQLKEEGLPNLEIVRTAMQNLGFDTDLVSALAETAMGRWSTFKDSLVNMASIVTQPIFDTLSQSLGDINNWLVQIGPQLEMMATALAGSIANAIIKVRDLIAAFQTEGTGGLLVALGLSPEMLASIQAGVAYIIEQFNQLSAVLAPSLASIQESLTRLGVTFGETGITAQSFTTFLLAMADFIFNKLIPAWVQWIGFLAGVAASTISLWVTYIQAVQGAWVTLSGFIQSDVIPVLLAINDGITVVNSVLASLGNLVTAVVNKALQAMAGLWQNVVFPALKKTGDFLNSTLFPVFQSVGKTVNEDVSPALRTLGEEVMPILQTGLDYVTEAIKKTISFFDSLADKVNSFSLPDILTPGSPPPMAIAMMDIANATNLANQAVSGMLDSLASNKWGEIQANVLNLVDDMQDEGFYASRGFGKSTGFAIKQAFIRAFTKNFQGILSGSISGETLRALTQAQAGAYAERVTGDFDKIIRMARAAGGQMLQELKQELLEALPSAAGGLSSVASQFAEMLEPQMSDRAKFIKKMQDFLASGSDELFRFDFAPALAGTDHVMLNRLRTQEQLNYLLAEQRKQEIEITKQKEAQQKLTFLQAQIDLIKIGRELGGNIFQGITFGLHADAEDLLAATNRVVEAMIGQIHTTLEIGSPSQIMVEVGQQIMAGLQRGIVSMTPTLNAQLSASVMGPLSPMMAGALSAGNTSTTVNNWNVGGNSINNGVDAATFEARVLQVIRRNL